MIELPTCRWRRELTVEKHHRCASPKLIHGPNGVHDALCATCHLRDHPRPPLQLWLARLSWLNLPALRLHARRWLRFAAALARHALAGFPRATAADVAFRDSVCGPCFWRDKEHDACSKCGCNLGGVKYLPNKKWMALEQCPMYDPQKRPGEYWGPVKGETIYRRLWRRLTGR